MRSDENNKPNIELVIRGSFTRHDGDPIVGASVNQRFLGCPPLNLGTCFGLNEAPALTDASGQFELTVEEEEEGEGGSPGNVEAGTFLVLAVQDSRTLGFAIATGSELASSPLRLVALPSVDMQGIVIDETGRPIAGAEVVAELYNLTEGMEKFPVNFWLYTGSWQSGINKVVDLGGVTNERGEFRIPNCPAIPGKLSLTVSHPDFATLEVDYPCGNAAEPEPLVMQKGGLIRLQVGLPDGTPAAGFNFFLEGKPDRQHNRSQRPGVYRSGITDEDGLCEFLSLPAGSYVARYMGGGGEPWACYAIEVSRLGKGEKREFAVKPISGSVLCGQVVDEITREPLQQAEIRFESARYPGTGSTFQAACTDATGRFQFGFPIAPGTVEIVLSYGDRISKRSHAVVSTQHQTELLLTI